MKKVTARKEETCRVCSQHILPGSSHTQYKMVYTDGFKYLNTHTDCHADAVRLEQVIIGAISMSSFTNHHTN